MSKLELTLQKILSITIDVVIASIRVINLLAIIYTIYRIVRYGIQCSLLLPIFVLLFCMLCTTFDYFGKLFPFSGYGKSDDDARRHFIVSKVLFLINIYSLYSILFIIIYVVLSWITNSFFSSFIVLLLVFSTPSLIPHSIRDTSLIELDGVLNFTYQFINVMRVILLVISVVQISFFPDIVIFDGIALNESVVCAIAIDTMVSTYKKQQREIDIEFGKCVVLIYKNQKSRCNISVYIKPFGLTLNVQEFYISSRSNESVGFKVNNGPIAKYSNHINLIADADIEYENIAYENDDYINIRYRFGILKKNKKEINVAGDVSYILKEVKEENNNDISKIYTFTTNIQYQHLYERDGLA